VALTAARNGLKSRAIHAIHGAHHPTRLALVDEQRELTYAQANDEMNRLAQALGTRFAAVAGTPVILMMQNRVEYVVAWFALARLGGRSVHASYRLTTRELEYLVRHSNARIAISDETSFPAVAALKKAHPTLPLSVIVVGQEPPPASDLFRYTDVVAGAVPAFPPRRRGQLQSENIVYTSGTTGKPKGAVRDFASFGLTELFRVLERLPFRLGERHLIVSPMYHSAGQIFSLLQSALGGTLYLRPHFEPLDTLKFLSRWGVESVFMVPTMIRRILQLPQEEFQRHATPHLRALISGASEFPQPLREAAIARFGAGAVHDFYGATEIGWVTVINGNEMLRKPMSVGKPLAGQEVRILDEDGTAQPLGQVGTIYVRNAQTMAGYLNDPSATAAGQRGEWVTVEDLGWLDADGYLFLAGRARDMVKSGGMNVYPVEIEEVLGRHPSISEAAVIGLPDEDLGERLAAVVVPKVAGVFDVAEVAQFARVHLSGFKIPKQWEVVGELPRNATGKIVKTELRARFGTPGPGH
jgi:acyl-CoA synthetase (AMP-forming)/AMP-acid ligase II